MPTSQQLADWYATHARPLPFRATRDPYAIWVSEIMAQQTRIAALLPYYTRFMAAFPTVAALAAAPLDDVLTHWAGLGYYSRARSLHRAAVQMAQSGVPQDVDGWRALPGVGDYTAAAVCSIAYEQPVAAVDGNVLRVFARVCDYRADVLAPEGKKQATAWATALYQGIHAPQPSVLTQALMELGALVCLPKTPDCAACPLANLCESKAAGTAAELPIRSVKTSKKAEQRPVYVVIDDSGALLMRKRTERLLHGLWELPDALPEGLTAVETKPLGQAKHVFTHKVWQMHATQVRVQGHQPPVDGWCWVQDVSAVAVPEAFRKFLVGTAP